MEGEWETFLKCNKVKHWFCGGSRSGLIFLRAVCSCQSCPGSSRCSWGGTGQERALSCIPHHSAVPYLLMPPEIWLLYLCFTSQPLIRGDGVAGLCPALHVHVTVLGPRARPLSPVLEWAHHPSAQHLVLVSRAGEVTMELCSLLVLLERGQEHWAFTGCCAAERLRRESTDGFLKYVNRLEAPRT